MSCQSDQKDAVRRALQQIDVIKRMVDLYPEEMAFVRTAQGKNPVSRLVCIKPKQTQVFEIKI